MVSAVFAITAVGATLAGLQVVNLLMTGGAIDTPLSEASQCIHVLEHTAAAQPQTTQHSALPVEEAPVETSDGRRVRRFRLSNKRGMEATIITLGGALTSLRVPDAAGQLADITLGYDDVQDYESEDNPYLGSVIGRVSDRIAHGTFTLHGRHYRLTRNDRGHSTFNGGDRGWDKAVWSARRGPHQLILSHVSPDGDENFPGEVHANVTYTLREDDNELVVELTAYVISRPTPISLTVNHVFNLGGQGAGRVDDHHVQIFAEKFLPVDRYLNPIEERPVSGAFDLLTSPRRLGDVISDVTADGVRRGYDHSYCVRGAPGQHLAARVRHPGSGRVMEVFSNHPALHFSTGNYLNVARGKGGQRYPQHSGLSLVPQNYPNAVNTPAFPDSILYPGSTYYHRLSYRFSTQKTT